MTTEVTIPGKTVCELVQYWGSIDTNATPAFISVFMNGKNRSLSRKEVLDLSRRFAFRLKELGIKKGLIVCNALPNSLERVVCEFGIAFSGAASMNGQIFRTDGEDFLETLKNSKCSAVILDPSIPQGARNILLEEVPIGCENDVQSQLLPHLKHIIACTRDDLNPSNDFVTSLRNPALPEYAADVNPSDMVTVLTTSGTTGYSKLVRFSHANICGFGIQVKAIEPMNPGDHFINIAPMGWAGGYPQWYLSCGVTRYFFDMHAGPIPDVASAIWKTIVQEKIVYGFINPYYVKSILSNTSLWKNSHWKPKYLCLAGQPVKRDTLGVIGKLCDAVDINYGMTECNLVATHRIADPSSYIDNCVGYPGYDVQIKIVDIDMQEVDNGKTGQVLVKSPTLSMGYLNNEAATSSSFLADGWFCTDDAGYVGEDGKLYVEGRQSDTIMRAGYILYPSWLEKKFKEVPEVLDIVLVAVPDKLWGNEICACVVISGVEGVWAGRKPTDGCEDLNKQTTTSDSKFCEDSVIKNGRVGKQPTADVDLELLEKQLRSFADSIELVNEKDIMRLVPKYYVFMDKFPLTNSGKVSRKEMRKMAASLFDLL